MPCPLQSFGLSQAGFEKLVSIAEANGIDFVGYEGRTIYKGCTIHWSYDQTTGTLVVTCLDKPWYISCSRIKSSLIEFVAQALTLPKGVSDEQEV
jgi:hypothetical protein